MPAWGVRVWWGRGIPKRTVRQYVLGKLDSGKALWSNVVTASADAAINKELSS